MTINLDGMMIVCRSSFDLTVDGVEPRTADIRRSLTHLG